MEKTTHRTARSRRLMRGVSLIEAMIASVVLLIGLVGVLQGLMTAAQQNAIANKMTRAGAINRQVAAGLYGQGRGRLLGVGGLLESGAACDPALATYVDSQGRSLIDGLEGIGDFDSICVADLDVFDGAAPVGSQIVPSGLYSAADGRLYRRLVVSISDSSDPDVSYAAVVVTWEALGRRFYQREFMSFYNPVTNQTYVEL